MSIVSEEMSDQDVLEIYNQASYDRIFGTDFHFSLKNKVGGLARALRVFQVSDNIKQIIFLKFTYVLF